MVARIRTAPRDSRSQQATYPYTDPDPDPSPWPRPGPCPAHSAAEAQLGAALLLQLATMTPRHLQQLLALTPAQLEVPPLPYPRPCPGHTWSFAGRSPLLASPSLPPHIPFSAFGTYGCQWGTPAPTVAPFHVLGSDSLPLPGLGSTRHEPGCRPGGAPIKPWKGCPPLKATRNSLG